MDINDLVRHFRSTDVDIANIIKAQNIAAECLNHMNFFLKTGMSREEIHQECERYMLDKGSEGWWIHNDPALILYGDLTTYSAHEDPSVLFVNKRITDNDLITIDVALMIGNGWGDMARSFVMENGKIIPWINSSNQEIIDGMNMEQKLHQLFMEYVDENTTFSKLHHLIDEYLISHDYYNCDYHQNFGHTIENDQKDRITIAEGVDIRIVEYDKPITFEPHICKTNGTLGIKHEDMYAYINGKMQKVL